MLMLARRSPNLSVFLWMSSTCCFSRFPANTSGFVLNVASSSRAPVRMVNVSQHGGPRATIGGGFLAYSTRCIAAVSTRSRSLRSRRFVQQPSASASSLPSASSSPNDTGSPPPKTSPQQAAKASSTGAKTGVPGETSKTASGVGFGDPQSAAPPVALKTPRNRLAKTPKPRAPPRGNNLLVVGLGNPGEQFKLTRHNAGFLVAEELARRYGGTLKIKTAFMGEYCSVKIKGKSVGILRPITFMNLSGQSARKVVEYFKLPIHAALTVVDEVALDFGQLRIKTKGSAGGHNGLKSMQTQLKTQEYPRLRIGVGAAGGGAPLSNYVLGEFSRSEKRDLDNVIADACDAVEHWIEEENMEKVMTRWNTR